MSLANENDLIIKDTVGIISTIAKESNRHIDKTREQENAKETKYNELARYLTELPKIHAIVQGRCQGIPLEALVNPSRIANDVSRAEQYDNTPDEGKENRAYEDWFRA